ncbi:MAG: class III signal peptide-containing protein [Candidatus Diapherotrites archaeon]|nr:class III signal peptide-containing protein [Candidatus Diapherotrites archaeon]
MDCGRVSQKGQLSLEFLLIMAGFVLALAVFAPVALKSAKAALFAMEAQRAQAFLSEFSSEARQVSFLGEGTVKEVKANALKEWLFEAGNGTAKITVESEALGREKTFSEKIPAEVLEFSGKINGKMALRLAKSETVVVVSSIDEN